MENKTFCPSHESTSQKVAELLEACAANTTTIKFLMWLFGGAGALLLMVASVYLPMMYQNGKRADAQISAAIAGAASNRKDNVRQDEILHDHETRLRTGGL
ncbi:MAG: hypothetical protein EOM24_12490 [Chloroflexia bacterium]|nr:hypothetical protein [Chloroflexia bacterium]